MPTPQLIFPKRKFQNSLCALPATSWSFSHSAVVRCSQKFAFCAVNHLWTVAANFWVTNNLPLIEPLYIACWRLLLPAVGKSFVQTAGGRFTRRTPTGAGKSLPGSSLVFHSALQTFRNCNNGEKIAMFPIAFATARKSIASRCGLPMLRKTTYLILSSIPALIILGFPALIPSGRLLEMYLASSRFFAVMKKFVLRPST